MFRFESARPSSQLRPFIRAYVQRETLPGGEVLVEPVVARLGVMLDLEFAGSYEAVLYGSEDHDATFPIAVIGPQTWRRARLIASTPVESLVVMFQPCGFYALFGVPTISLAETGVEGHSLLGPRISGLHQRLGNLRTFTERSKLLNEYFEDRLSFVRYAKTAYRALHVLTDPDSDLKVGEVARQMGVSLRDLERKSLLYAGVSPAKLRRISRFSRALHLRTETRLKWAEIAQRSGYHDQMHMVHDFRVFAGEAPKFAADEIIPGHLINFCSD